MAQFQYTAVNNAGQKLTGVISAETEEEARKQLNTLGIAVLAIEKQAETNPQSSTSTPDLTKDLPKFEFEAYDKQGRKILGTVPASSRFKAFERLVNEYQFEVAYVVNLGASEAEKEQAKVAGLSALKAEYETELKKRGEKTEVEPVANAAFEAKRQELLKKVDFLLEKIKSVLNDFQNDITPEAKKIIQGYIDKLLRIKSSTNLDYIEHTSEELLKKIQEQEVFLTKERTVERRAKLQLEAQKMMASLHSKPISLEKNTIEQLQKQWASAENPALKWVGLKLKRHLPSSAEKVLSQKIKLLSDQIWTYRRILWTTPANARTEVKLSLQKLLADRYKLQDDLRLLEKARHKGKIRTETGEEIGIDEGSPEPLLLEEAVGFLNWLLIFYLSAYFISLTLRLKQTGWILPSEIDILSSELLRTIFMSVFIWTLVLNLHLSTLKYQKGGLLLSLPFGIIVNWIILQNI